MDRWVHILPLLFAALNSLSSTQALAAQCNSAAAKGIPALGAETVVTPPAEKTIAAGETFAIRWQRGRFAERYPAYLMIGFDRAVRFEGEGFYALLPGAQAAFSIEVLHDRTRAVVPYYGLGVPREGEIEVRPLEAGPLNIEWAIVGHDGCKEVGTGNGRGSFNLHVEATGLPEIVVNDFAGSQPDQLIYSPAGTRTIQIFDGRYRLVDERSGAEVSERSGRFPRFSPTGRYVAAYVEEGMEIVDAVDGKTVYLGDIGEDLAWDDADSFAVLNRGPWGSIAVLAPSLSEPTLLAGNGACHACGGTDSTAVRIDLENNVAVYSGPLNTGFSSLTVDAKGSGTPKEVRASVKRQSQVTKFRIPKRWEFRDGLKFSNLASEAAASRQPGGQDPFETALRKFLVKPLFKPPNEIKVADDESVQAIRWRGLTYDSATASGRGIGSRLEEFGIPVPDQKGSSFVRDSFVLSDNWEGIHDEAELAAVDALADRMEAEVPVARRAFGEKAYSTACLTNIDEATQRYLTVVRKFQRAFRFENGERVVWLTHYQCKEGSGAFSYPSVAILDSGAEAPWILQSEIGETEGVASSEGRCFGNIADCDFDANVAGGHLLVLSSADTRAIEIVDLDTRQNVFKKYNAPRGDLLREVFISPDETLVLQVNADGSFVGYRMADAAELFQGRYVDDEVVVWTPDGHFDATSEGAQFVSLRLPGRVGTHTFEQFSAQLKTPDLVARLLAGETFPPVQLVSPPSLSGVVQGNDGAIGGHIEAIGETPLESLIVLQDGLLTDRIPLAGSTASLDLNVALLEGTRWASLVAVDQHGLASAPMGRKLSPPADAKRRIHVLAVGVDEYTDPDIPDLDLAGHDAQRFAEAMGTLGGDVMVASTRVLRDRQATREGVIAALRETMAEAPTGETVVLFFAGHGIRDDDGTYYLATEETNLDDMGSTALAWDEVGGLLREKPGRVAVFLDTCHSGAAGTGAFATNDNATKSLLERVPSGIVVFSASKGRELSEESADYGGGIFTSALLNVIAEDRDTFDSNQDGAIEISELYRGVKGEVTSRTGGRQTPWIARNQMVGDFALF